jgi:tetratricopeptide (TPR) repeat protein
VFVLSLVVLAGAPRIGAARTSADAAAAAAATAAATADAADAATTAAATTPEERPSLADALDFSDASAPVRRALFRVQTLLRREGDDEALDVLLRYTADHPDQDHPLVEYYLGSLLQRRGDTAAALPHLRQATELDPSLWPAWRARGEVAYAEEQYAEAATCFAATHARQPEPPPELLHYEAASWILAQQPAKALPPLDELLSGRRGTPERAWYRAYVAACLDAGEPQRARAATDDLVERFPDDAGSWYLAYQQAAAATDWERAALYLEATGFLRPLTHLENRQLGDLYSSIGVPLTAARYYAAALAGAPDSVRGDLYEQLAAAHLSARRHAEALEVLDRGLTAAPNARLWSLKGDVHYVKEEYDAAAAAFASAAELAPKHGRYHLMQGYCAWEMGQYETAAGHLRRAGRDSAYAETAARLLRHVEAERN